MKKKVFHVTVYCFAVIAWTFVASNVVAFDNEAHKALSERAITVSGVDNFLKTVLRYEFPQGTSHSSLAGRTVVQLIQDGAVLEDSPFRRVINHFHNPKLSWDQAGLRPPGATGPVGESSVAWGQNANQGSLYGGKASWHQAREAYFRALTATDPFARKVRWAETFRFLGHAIHHVQDAAAPSHTRNDSHLSGINTDLFHSFSERSEILALIRDVALLPAQPLEASYLGNLPSPDSRYPVPISRLLDTSAGDIGAAALGDGSGMGVAEYSNANFFSEDTIFPETFPYPGLANLQFSAPELDPATGKKKNYLRFKPGFGETNYSLAQASSLRNISSTTVSTDIGLDYKVLKDYGLKLFPRAISYSAGLINYFFRGKIDSTLWPIGYIWVPWESRPSSIRVENVSVKVDGTNEQGGQGTMRLVLLYSYRYANTPSGAPRYVVSHPVSVSASSTPQSLTFQFDSLPFPLTAPALSGSHGYVYYGHLVYKGELGQEPESVVVDSYCMYNGVRYDRWYVFEHGPSLNGQPIESAYMSEC